MGLTSKSTGNTLLNEDFEKMKNDCNYTIALAGNPNVGKSTIFNNLTGMHQHTGNWPGKTVSNAAGICEYKNAKFLLVDIPGTYSLMSNSEEEEIARNYICFGNPDCTVIVVDATCLERNLNLVFQIKEITPNVIVCVNLLDEAKKKGIKIDLSKLENLLGCKVVGTTARKKKTLNKLLEAIFSISKNPNMANEIGSPLTYSKSIEPAIKHLTPEIAKIKNIPPFLRRFVGIKLLDDSQDILSSIEKNFHFKFSSFPTLQARLAESFEMLEKNKITKANFKDEIVTEMVNQSATICRNVCKYEKNNYSHLDRKIDKILTSKKFGIPIMILFLGILFWLTIVGSNYPSEILFNFFSWVQAKLLLFFDWIHSPEWLKNMLVLGVFQTVTWIISVMLPPMAIFFPLFTFLEDLGFLPRLAFNMDGFFSKALTNGKQMITMCMGFGCNAAGVVGTRIIESPRERIIASVTNNFVPCNGRYPFLIAIASIFIAGSFSGFTASVVSTAVVIAVILLGIFLTLVISKILSKTILKGSSSSFILELPPFRKPQIGKIIIRSIFDRTLFVLLRAIQVAAPAGLVIWLFANIGTNGTSFLSLIAQFLDPFANLMGLDGYILTAFIFGMPANEIVLPIILMCYMGGSSLIDISDYTTIGKILMSHNWTLLTAINVMIFTVLHFPCTTTLLSIKKETGSFKWTALSFALPTICGILICMATNFVYSILN